MSLATTQSFIKRHASRGSCLVPRNIVAEEWLDGLKLDKEILLRIDAPRNPGHHRLLFAMLKVIIDNTEGRWTDIEHLLWDLKVVTGLVERRINGITKEEYVVAKSIAFASMPQDEFAAWFDMLVAMLAVNVLDIKKKEALEEIYKMAGEISTTAGGQR